LFQLDSRVAGYAVRLETASPKLELLIIEQTLSFVVRILSMDENRIARTCLKALILNYNPKEIKFNWASNFKSILDRSNHQHLWKELDPNKLYSSKTKITDTIKTLLKNEDMERSQNSLKHYYGSQLAGNNRLIDITSVPFYKLRIFAQVRLNPGIFYLRGEKHSLDHEMNCKLCNLDSHEDLFHFLYECRVHESSRSSLLSNLVCDEISRDNHLNMISKLKPEDYTYLYDFVTTCLKRRKFILEE